jgi:iron complex outermembrane recepter protein
MRRLSLTTSLIALAFSAAPALAQTATPSPVDTAADAESNPADIVVTAQLREERLQEVPIAITVVSGAALENQGRVNLEGAVNLIPTFNFLKSGTTLNQSLFLRGVGTATFSIAGEPSVSTVLDGVVLARSGEAFQELVDIDRLEVLRGPQGTLFGKNASAGVINIVTRAPVNEFEGYAEAGYFSDEEVRGRLLLNVPLTDNFIVRATGYYANWDGNITNVARTRNRTVNGYERYGGRIKAALDFSDTVTSTFIFDYYKNSDDCCAEVIGTGPLTGAGLPGSNPVFAVLPTPRGDRTRRINQNLVTRTEDWGASYQLNVEAGDHVFTSITAFRDWKNTEIRDGDWLPAAFQGAGLQQLHDRGPQDSSTLSQELRLASPGNQFLDYVVGAYYSVAKNRRIFQRDVIQCPSTPAATPNPPVACGTAGAPPSTFPSAVADFGSKFQTLALFGQATVNFSENFRAIAGLRFTLDELDVFHSRNTTLAGPGIQPSFPVTPTGRGEPAAPFRDSTEADNLSGRVGLQLDVLEDSMLYGMYSRGYKGPAFNVFFNLTQTGVDPLEPEISDAFELGMKNTFFNGELVLNIAGFYAEYRNFQANNPDLVAGVVVTRFTNAGTVSTKGAELDLIWRPLPDLSISGGVAYTDAQVEQFRLPPGGNPLQVVPPGTELAFAPKWKGAFSVDYRHRTGGSVDFFVGAQANAQSSQLSQFSPDPVVRRFTTIDGYALVNLQGGIVSADDRFRVTAQVRNLFDESFAAAITSGGPGGSFRYIIPRDADRYYGITARVNF